MFKSGSEDHDSGGDGDEDSCGENENDEYDCGDWSDPK